MSQGPTTSHEFFKQVKAALNLPPHVERLVIEADIRQPLRVYVKGFVDRSAVPAIVAAVKDVAVAPDGTVTVTPLDDSDPPHVAGA